MVECDICARLDQIDYVLREVTDEYFDYGEIKDAQEAARDLRKHLQNLHGC